MVIPAITAQKSTNLTSFKGNQNAKQVMYQSGKSEAKQASHSSRFLFKLLIGLGILGGSLSSCKKHEMQDVNPVVKPVNTDSTTLLGRKFIEMSKAVFAVDSNENRIFESIGHKVLAADGSYIGDMETKTISVTADTIKTESSFGAYKSITNYVLDKKDKYLRIADGNIDQTAGAVRLVPDGKSMIGTDLKNRVLNRWTPKANSEVSIEYGYPKLKSNGKYIRKFCKMMIKK